MRLERQAGFTLLELVVTLAIVAVLGVLTVPVMEVTRQRVKEQSLTRALREIRGALDAYKRAADDGLIEVDMEASGYPANLNVLVEGVPRVEGKKKSKNTKLYFLRRVPRDPMDESGLPNAADTWGKRSFASEPIDPREGDDVFDVYSRSQKLGLNGLAYNKW
jgi:general secretion pathway protein G